MIVLLVLLAYAIGAIPFAFLLSRRIAGIDIRLAGSGNLGAANVLRTTGIRPGIIVALLDMAKGAVVVAIAERAGLGVAGRTGLAMAAVVGHMFPAWLRLRGGKGVATACGAFAVLAPAATGLSLGLFLLTVWRTRYVSLASLVATASLAPLAYLTGAPRAVVMGACATAALIVVRHRSNLVRLREGTERRLGERA
jgi:glycerol-3-phosphate acyltransferase PlsY